MTRLVELALQVAFRHIEPDVSELIAVREVRSVTFGDHSSLLVPMRVLRRIDGHR